MQREKHKWLKPRGESTDVEHWGGSIRTSDEDSVMESEQRDRVRWLHSTCNWKQDEAMDATRTKPFNIDKKLCTTPTKWSKRMRARPG